MRAQTPLAWLQFTHRKMRLLAATGGVSCAVVLMFLEMGFLNCLFDSQTYVVKMLNADLIMVNQQKSAMLPQLPFPKKRLVQARGHAGIQAAYPLYVEELHAVWKNSRDKHDHPIMVFGIDPHDPVFLIPEVAGQAAQLKLPDTALIDSRSKDFYGDLAAGRTAELARHAIRVVGTFPMGPDFRVDGNVIVSTRTFFKCFASPRTAATAAAKVELGLLRVRPGADVLAVRASLQEALPGDVRVLTKQEFIDQVEDYWATSQPVGQVFGLGTLVGLFIGVAICYQILFTDITDHLPQYAALKAIGYGNGFLIKVVLQGAFYLSVAAFFAGLLLSVGLYAALHAVSGLLLQLTPGRVLLVFVLTVSMCLFSGAIALRKVIRSDPAEVFA